MFTIGKTEQLRDAQRVIIDPLGEDLAFELRGEATIGLVEQTLWTANVTKHWNLNAESFYIASDEENDKDVEISLVVLREGGIQESLFVFTDVTDGRTPILLPGGNMLAIQHGIALGAIEGDIWIGRDGPSFSMGVPSNVPGNPIGGGEVEGHIAKDKLVTRHPFFTIPHRITNHHYQDKWRALVVRGQHYCTEKVEVAIYAYPALITSGKPRWELDRQSFSGNSTPFEFSPAIGVIRGEPYISPDLRAGLLSSQGENRIFLAGSRFEVTGISKMGANVSVQSRVTIALVRDGTEFQRDLSPP